MIPVLFHLGPLTVYSFGLMMALGFLAADYVIRLECVRRGFDPEYSSSIVIAAAVMGLIGSRIYAILDDLPTYLADPKSMIFSGSGFVFYGGMIGGLLGAYLVSRWYRIGFAVTWTCVGWRSRSDRQSAEWDASLPATATGACLPPCRGRWPIRAQ